MVTPGHHTYCSVACRQLHKGVVITCTFCGTEQRRPKSQVKPYENFCDEACAAKKRALQVDCAFKVCGSCGERKPHAAFYRLSRSKSGLASHCKACKKTRYPRTDKDKQRAHERYIANREKLLPEYKRYRENNREKVSECKKRWYRAHAEEVKARVRARARAHPEKIKAYLERTRPRRLKLKKQYRFLHREQIAAYAKDYRDRRREWFLKYMTGYNAANRDRLRELKKVYREAKKDEISYKYRANITVQRARTRAWQRANPHRVLAAALRRRQRILDGQIQNFSTLDLRRRFEVFGNRCAYCGGIAEHVDHVKPLARGGPHCLANLRPACAPCNQSKSAMDPKRWLAKLPRPQPMPLP